VAFDTVMSKKIIVMITIWISLSPLAMAHELSNSEGFVSGLLHPVFGLDHLFAMLGVGFVSALMGGLGLIILPIVFVTGMILGGVFGIMGLQAPFLESMIAFSVILFGLFLRENRNTLLLSSSICLWFGIFHGNAHGVELPHMLNPIYYILGFILSTIAIHVVGVLAFSKSMESKRKKTIQQVLSSFLIVSGLFFVLNLNL
jgi:urease accessory protein